MTTRLLHDLPIARKVTVVILMTCTTALIIAGVALFAVQVATFRQSVVGELSAITAIIAGNTAAPVSRGDRRGTLDMMRALGAKPTVTYASIRLNDGTPFISYGLMPATPQNDPTPKVKGVTFVGSELVIRQPIFHDGLQIGMLQVGAGYHDELHRLKVLYAAILVGVLTVAIFVAFLISFRLRRSISDPILKLAETARVVAEKNDYSVRAQKLERKNELGIFTDSFNKMLAQIQAQDRALQASRDELERMVVDRTRQLSTSNRKLQCELEERQRAEQETRKARVEADRANQAKGEFLSRMSHELRTPMNAILGFAQLLEIDFESRESQNAEGRFDFSQERHSVDQILKGGGHLLEVMNEVLDLSAIEAGRLSISCEAVALNEVIQESVNLVRPLTRERKIELVSGWGAGEVGFAFADRQRIKQVLLNILSNAIKYNRHGGMVTIYCAGTPIKSTEGPASASDLIRIDITDTGPGISAENLEQLFQPFQRLGAERTDIGGTGLGLSLAKRMVELMGGQLTVKSTVGQGSTFTIELLLAEAPKVDPGTLDGNTWSHDGANGARTILLVEGNLANLDLVESILAPRPHMKVIPAMQGRLAVRFAREHKPDLVLLDLDLPDMHGREVLMQLQYDPATRDLPIVIISADEKKGQRNRLLADGAFAFLKKPLDVREFIETIDRALAESEPAVI